MLRFERLLSFSLLFALFTLGCDESTAPPGAGGPGPTPDGGPGCPMPEPETCNGVDDDCDGNIDEQSAQVGSQCDTGCGVGTYTCEAGELTCAGAGTPQDEVCNGADDDCDGIIDEDAAQVGEDCATCPGSYRCVSGELVCSGGNPEMCNGEDDDCDGATDEGVTRPCGVEMGACTPGVESCVDGEWGVCIGAGEPMDEACNGADDDCDGNFDEGLDDCQSVGVPCGGDDDCATGLCLDDDGSRYCSRGCDMAADDCGEGFTCRTVNEQPVCMPDFPSCESDCDCPDRGTACMPARNMPNLERACRPLRSGALAVGEECDPLARECASGLCSSRIRRCVRLCCGQDACGPGLGCVALPGNAEPVCVAACTADADCPARSPESMAPQEICRYRPDAEMTRNIGICDWPNANGVALGEVCEGGAQCATGLCWQPSPDRMIPNYCTKGCEDDPDCPDGWECRESMLNGLPVGICRQD